MSRMWCAGRLNSPGGLYHLHPMWLFKMHLKLLCYYILFIIFVSVIDIYWLIRNQSIISEIELNPVGQFLILIDGGKVDLFIICKIIGTSICIGVLYNIFKVNKTKGLIIAGAIAIFQLFLLLFLYFGHFCVYIW